ncbi:hypothetical protein HZ326_18267 [Fusarium oxysporum f. sp. albedinis]|nr:hypothetical protein HZ326_18267 [Fusarium oxysporum f. sp. albedinis]
MDNHNPTPHVMDCHYQSLILFTLFSQFEDEMDNTDSIRNSFPKWNTKKRIFVVSLNPHFLLFPHIYSAAGCG